MGSGEVVHVVISVREEETQEQQTPHADPQSFWYFSYLMFPIHVLMMILLIIGPHEIRNKEQSPFKAHGGLFMITAIASSSMVFLASGILIFASFFLQRWMKNIHYTVLKSIGVLSAHLAVSSVTAVIFVPQNLNLIACSVISLAPLVTYCFVWKFICRYHDEHKGNGYDVFHWTMFLCMLPDLFISLQKYLPPNLHWAQIPIICVSGSFVAVIALINTIRLLLILKGIHVGFFYYVIQDISQMSPTRLEPTRLQPLHWCLPARFTCKIYQKDLVKTS